MKMSGCLKEIIIGAIITSVILAGVIVYLSFGWSSCELVEGNPLSADNKLVAVVLESSSKSTLVSFLGYLKYSTDSKETFLPLVAQKVGETKNSGAETTLNFQIEADCAELNFNLVKSADTIQVETIVVELKRANKGYKTCTITKPGIVFNKNGFYSCQSGMLQCFSKDSDGNSVSIATLIIGDLKIETDRDSSAKDGEFHKEEQHC